MRLSLHSIYGCSRACDNRDILRIWIRTTVSLLLLHFAFYDLPLARVRSVPSGHTRVFAKILRATRPTVIALVYVERRRKEYLPASGTLLLVDS